RHLFNVANTNIPKVITPIVIHNSGGSPCQAATCTSTADGLLYNPACIATTAGCTSMPPTIFGIKKITITVAANIIGLTNIQGRGAGTAGFQSVSRTILGIKKITTPVAAIERGATNSPMGPSFGLCGGVVAFVFLLTAWNTKKKIEISAATLESEPRLGKLGP